MNILFYLSLTFNARHGGIANVSRFLGTALEKRGHQVIYLSQCETAPQQVETQLYLPEPYEVFAECNRQYFAKIIHDYHIDVVINQNGTTPSRYEAAQWSHELNIPIVTVLHNSLLGIYGDNKWLRRLHLPSNVRKKIAVHLFHSKYDNAYQRLARLSDRIVTLSDKFFDEVVEFAEMKVRDKIVAIPDPCTLPGCDKMPEKKKEIIYVGRLSIEKQVPLLLKIWAKLETKNPDWKLTVVGDGLDRGRCHRTAIDLNLQRITFEGHKDNPSPYYERGSIFCMTSSFEGFGLVLVEAMANYTIPLAFRSYANVSDIIDDGMCGFLVPPFDIDLYAEKIQQLINDEPLRIRMAQAAKQQSYKFSIDKIAMEWESLFKKIIK